jgi:hypothetical protein
MVHPFLEDATAEQRTTYDKGIDHVARDWSGRVDRLGNTIIYPMGERSTAKIRAAAIWHYAACPFAV